MLSPWSGKTHRTGSVLNSSSLKKCFCWEGVKDRHYFSSLELQNGPFCREGFDSNLDLGFKNIPFLWRLLSWPFLWVCTTWVLPEKIILCNENHSIPQPFAIYSNLPDPFRFSYRFIKEASFFFHLHSVPFRMKSFACFFISASGAFLQQVVWL